MYTYHSMKRKESIRQFRRWRWRTSCTIGILGLLLWIFMWCLWLHVVKTFANLHDLAQPQAQHHQLTPNLTQELGNTGGSTLGVGGRLLCPLAVLARASHDDVETLHLFELIFHHFYFLVDPFLFSIFNFIFSSWRRNRKWNICASGFILSLWSFF